MEKLKSGAFDGHGGLNKGQRLLDGPTLEEVLNETRDSANIFAYDSAATAGGAATESGLSVPGLKVGDVVLAVTPKTGGAAVAIAGWANLLDDAIDIDFTADPTAGKIVTVLVRRATT